MAPIRFRLSICWNAPCWPVVIRLLPFQLWSGGPTQDRFRFLVPVLPIAQALALAGAASVAGRLRARVVSASLAGALLLLPGWWSWRATEGDANGYAANLLQAHYRLGRDVLDHSMPDLVMAMDDAGIAPLECDRTNVDMVGLNDRHMAHVPGVFGLKVDAAYVLGRRPVR